MCYLPHIPKPYNFYYPSYCGTGMVVEINHEWWMSYYPLNSVVYLSFEHYDFFDRVATERGITLSSLCKETFKR